MTEGRRLLAVGAIVALGAAVCFSHVWAEPSKKPDRSPADTGSLPPADDRLTEDLVASRFTGDPRHHLSHHATAKRSSPYR